MSGMVRHAISVRGDQRFSTSVLLYSVVDLDLRAKLFLWTSRIKKISSGGSLGGPPTIRDPRQRNIPNNDFKTQRNVGGDVDVTCQARLPAFSLFT